MAEQHNTGIPRLRFGTLGWQSPAWSESYYPEDLPADWRLGYYANALSAVLVAAADWNTLPDAELAAWADDVHADFRFFLMADASGDVTDQLRRADLLGGCLGGLLWPVKPAPLACLAPVADMPSRMRGWGDAQGVRLVVLEVSDLDLRARRGLLEQLAPWLVRGQDTAVIVHDPGTPPDDVRQLQIVAELMGLA